MRPQFQPELPFLLLLDQSLYQQLFGFVSFATSFGKTDHRPNTESKPILFFIVRAAVLHSPILGTFRRNLEIQTAAIGHFVGFLFGLCGLDLAGV